MRRTTFAHTFSRDIKISREDTAWLKAAITEVEQGEMDARYVARMAVAAGYLLIGTTVAKERHYPVIASQHRYHDLNAKEDRQYVPDGSKALRAGTCADEALMGGLFGDVNSRQQRIERCKPYTGLDDNNFGWGLDMHKTFGQTLLPFEEAHVRTHARPELIDACINEPFTGYIECIRGDETFERVEHEIGQYIGTRVHRTLLRIPLSGDIDLPADVLPTDYVSMPKTSA